MPFTRRTFLTTAGALAAASATGCGATADPVPSGAVTEAPLPLAVAAESPWMANQVALTSDNTLFLGLPRFPGHEDTPSVARREPDGTVKPFPGNAWNEWQPGDDGQNAFVYVNSLHIFADGTVWCVDQGGLRPDAAPPELSTPRPGAQKLVRLDPVTGEVLTVLRFGEDILPAGARMNDLRIHGSLVYVTDSGLGGLVVHDLSTGESLRRLSGSRETQADESAITTTPAPGQNQNQHRTPKSDMIEVSADGAWLYWAAPTGPFRRIRTDILRDGTVADADLPVHIEQVAEIPQSGGCAMDTLGNLYLSDLNNRQIVVLSPDGQRATLAADPGLVSPDGSFIGSDRTLYVPASQSRLTQLFGNATDLTTKPFKVYSVALPASFNGITLGDPVTGG